MDPSFPVLHWVFMYLSLLTESVVCPDSEIEDVVLCSMICEKLHQTFGVFSGFGWSLCFRFRVGAASQPHLPHDLIAINAVVSPFSDTKPIWACLKNKVPIPWFIMMFPL